MLKDSQGFNGSSAFLGPPTAEVGGGSANESASPENEGDHNGIPKGNSSREEDCYGAEPITQ